MAHFNDGLHLFDRHVAEFVGVKDFAAIEALDEFDIVFACHNSDPGMLTDRIHGVLVNQWVVWGRLYPRPYFCQLPSFDPGLVSW